MPRICLGVEYDGTAYCGWQRQKHSPSVQQHLERALSSVADAPVVVTAAGRTDTGVHASGQVLHFDSNAERTAKSWVLGANSNLPDDISVRWARDVDADFNARFDAVERRYRYLILNTRSRSALFARRAWVVNDRLQPELMQQAGSGLVGEHDFSAFRAAGCQAKHPVRTIRQLRVVAVDDWIVIDVAANAFLHHMVRNIVGLLVAVGNGGTSLADSERILRGRDRTKSAAAAPAHGLFLTQVLYPGHFELPLPAADDDALLPALPLVPVA